MTVVTNLEPKRQKPSTALEDLTALVADDLARVNELIVKHMDSPVALIPQLGGYIVAAGGKRLRPVLTLAAANLCRYQGTKHQLLAAVVEFIHTATLLHDDVVDESNLRRGLASANAVFGNKASVLVGDFLFSRSFQLMVEAGSLEALDILSNASAVIAQGEVLQLQTTNDITTTEDAYLEVIKGKTAELFAAACRVGGVVADVDETVLTALWDYGMNLGIAFQLVDDVLDYSAHQATLGKTVGDDFREGKLTLPVILSVERGDAEERAFWQRTMEELEQTDEDLAHAQALMVRHNALIDTVARARHYGSLANTALTVFPDSPLRQALENVVEFVISRDF
ncbi:octaprenyl-diphosphate synthase [Azospirillum fermentarium]|uniref:polyprenyl synthetase family protein n=1 Tax=Azospirillum fermentarium TaxID=1233114 RepID=UPI0022260B24|nr:polyprenyl synthetase family protein [Azospirillum fermentarium]MCW2247668.1 octaprenyl-diphosphate synthase [Azospirillum fermentarium]